MTKHKKQHYVPACYLRAWCDPNAPSHYDPYVWIFDKDGSKSKARAPDNILHETDMYTIQTPGGGRNLVLEKGLSQLETEFTRLRDTKLQSREPMEPEEHALLCAFTAAAHIRTKLSRDHWKSQWKGPLKMMEELSSTINTATPEQKESMAKISKVASASTDKSNTLNYDQVKALHETPLQHLLFPAIRAETPELARLDMALYETEDDIGFITSDNPCVWYDPLAYKRPPMYRAPALMYKSIEITMPISPNLCLFLNRQGTNGYIPINKTGLDEVNRRTRFFSGDHFLSRVNRTIPIWFDPGVEPKDSWEKQQASGDSEEDDS